MIGRASLLAGALVLALAPAAAAQAGPELRTFDDVPAQTDVTTIYGPSLAISVVDGDDCGADIEPDPNPAGPGDQAAVGACGPTFTIAFDDPQAHVALRARAESAGSFGALALAPARITLTARRSGGAVVDSRAVTVEEGTWTPLTVASVGGAEVIDDVTVSGDMFYLAIDDLMFARSPQPETTIGGGPPVTTASRDAAFALGASVPGSGFECSLDGAAFTPCSAAPSYRALADGPHTFRARARDPYGIADATPAARRWTVVPPPPPEDPDGDGVPSSLDNCPDQANSSQADEDIDEIGNTCELLPSGTIRPVAGLRTRVRTLSGTVFIKLPREAALAQGAQLPPGFVPLKGTRRTSVDTPQESGYIPLEGVATVPIGSTIDARKGRVAVTTATTYARRSATRTGRFAAAIFTIKQARRRGRTAPRRPPTDLVLRTPPGLSRACATAATTPPKGIVRALTGSVVGPAKGRFRAVGAASVTTVDRGTWITQDRCNGTLTEVGRGRATVRDTGRKRTVTVGPGRAYLARARLFAAKRRRATES